MKWFLTLFLSFYLAAAVYLIFKISTGVDDIVLILEEVHSSHSLNEACPIFQ